MTASSIASRTEESSGLAVGFLAQIEHPRGELMVEGVPRSAAATGLSEGLDLFMAGEDLGYDVGYVRSRHLQDILSAPLLFLTAAGQRTRTLQLGTAVIPLRFENSARLAEELASADLLCGGRLRPGVSSGYAAQLAPYLGAFGHGGGADEEWVERLLPELVRLLDGEIVGLADTHMESVAPGTALRVQPHSPGLRERLAYGAASPQRARFVGGLGLRLQLATLHPDDGTGRAFADLQRETIDAYREASRGAGHGEGHVTVTRQMLPVRDESELERYQTLLERERATTGGVDAEHRAAEIGGRPAIFGPVVLDRAEVVAEALLTDVAVEEADELVLVLPATGDTVEMRRVLTTFAQTVLPVLSPGRAR